MRECGPWRALAEFRAAAQQVPALKWSRLPVTSSARIRRPQNLLDGEAGHTSFYLLVPKLSIRHLEIWGDFPLTAASPPPPCLHSYIFQVFPKDTAPGKSTSLDLFSVLFVCLFNNI